MFIAPGACSVRRVRVGETVHLRLSSSEVCAHLRVDDQCWHVRVLEHGAQLVHDDGTAFSFLITHAEAGIGHDIYGLFITAPERAVSLSEPR